MKEDLFSYSIVILSYNHPELTAKTLSSVLELGFPPSQIVLVHNGSEQKNSEALQKAFQNVEHLILAENRGYSGGANAGLRYAFNKTTFVLFLTNDIEMLSLPRTFPDANLLTPLILKRNTQQVDSVLGVFNAKTGKLRHLRSLDSQPSGLNDFLYPPGTAFGISKKCFEDLKGFDETYHTYWEDVDLGVRARQKSYTITHDTSFSLRHKIGKTCHKDRFYTLYLFQRNRRHLMNKHGFSNFAFRLSYMNDMLQIFFRICLKPRPLTPLKLWWKAVYD